MTADNPTGELAVATIDFDAFYAAHRSPVGRALALTLRDAELASEAVDEAMARAYQRWTKVSRFDNPGGWVYRVGLNWARSFVRQRNRPTPTWLTDQAVSHDNYGIDPTVDRALGQLSVDHRAVVVCRYLIGYSESQTCAALGLRPGTAKSRLARATAQLQSLLAPFTQEDVS